MNEEGKLKESNKNTVIDRFIIKFFCSFPKDLYRKVGIHNVEEGRESLLFIFRTSNQRFTTDIILTQRSFEHDNLILWYKFST